MEQFDKRKPAKETNQPNNDELLFEDGNDLSIEDMSLDDLLLSDTVGSRDDLLSEEDLLLKQDELLDESLLDAEDELLSEFDLLTEDELGGESLLSKEDRLLEDMDLFPEEGLGRAAEHRQGRGSVARDEREVSLVGDIWNFVKTHPKTAVLIGMSTAAFAGLCILGY